MTPSDQSYRLIPLSKGQYAIVDTSDFIWLGWWKWHAHWSVRGQCFYARRLETVYRVRTVIWMHRQILGLEPGDPRIGDHRISENTLDNRRQNLRIATTAQNNSNARRRIDNISGFKGVHRDRNGYVAQHGGKYLGKFPTPELAYARYCEEAVKVHAEFARLA